MPLFQKCAVHRILCMMRNFKRAWVLPRVFGERGEATRRADRQNLSRDLLFAVFEHAATETQSGRGVAGRYAAISSSVHNLGSIVTKREHIRDAARARHRRHNPGYPRRAPR